MKLPGLPPPPSFPNATFGDKRPAPARMPVGKRKITQRRALKPGAAPMPHIETYRQTNGSLYLTRFAYGLSRVWITGIGDSEADALDNAQQFYMNHTTQGRDDSEVSNDE